MDGAPPLTELPSIVKAKLPASYEGAKTALAECTRLDECQDWADRAEALASYAKQAQDEELRKMADRIQARAIRRCGELLTQIKSASQANLVQNRSDRKEGAHPSVTRTGIAREAGLSDHQRKQAVRIARVPDPEFERAVEQDEPQTVTALAERGRQSAAPRADHLKGRNPEDFKHATALLGLLRHIERTGATINLVAAVRGLSPREVDEALDALIDAERWLESAAAEIRG